MSPTSAERDTPLTEATFDLAPNGTYDDGTVTLTADRITVRQGSRLVERVLDELESVAVQNQVVGGALVAKSEAGTELLARFTQRHAVQMGYFARRAEYERALRQRAANADGSPSGAPGAMGSGTAAATGGEGDALREPTIPADQVRSCPRCGRAFPDPERPVCPYCLDKRSLFLRVLSYLRGYGGLVTVIVIFMVASAALKLATPFLGGRVLFDEALAPGGELFGRVGIIVIGMVVSQVLAIACAVVFGRLNSRVAVAIIFHLKTEIFAAMQRLSMSFFSKKQTGGLLTRVNYDTTTIQYFFHDGVPFFLVNSVQILAIGAVMAVLDWRLTILVLLPTPVIVYLTKVFFPRIWQLYSRQFRRQSILTGLVNDVFTGARVVKAFGKESTEIERFHPRNEDVYRSVLDTGRLQSILLPSLFGLMGLGSVLIWGIGGYWVMRDTVSFGTLMSFLGYLAMVYGPLQFMTNIVDWWSHSMNSAQRIFEILDTEPDVVERSEPVRIDRIDGLIEFDHVTFAYEVNNPVLHDVTLTVKPGEVIGLVGHTGAGKSTITNLVTRLYDVDEGAVRIDGVDVRDLSIDDLKRQVAIVLQETYLFVGSVADNIAYGRDDAGLDEIIAAASAAHAHDFICKLPEGYDTIIGRDGHDLSGGERQRIAIARAVLRDPRILILDEATSSVDTETEQRIQAAIERLITGRTVIAIAHRLSTLKNADRLVVVEHGRIVEQGLHEELMEIQDGVYRGLVEKQRKALEVIGVGE